MRATGVGSLPLTDPAAAATLAANATPELPAIPELPRRDGREGLFGRALARVPGAAVGPDGSVVLEDPGAGPGAVDPGAPLLRQDAWRSAAVALDAWRGTGATSLKVQLCGPVTLAASLAAAGAGAEAALVAASAIVRAEVAALTAEARAATSHAARVVAVLDEPSLATGAADRWPRRDVTEALAGSLRAARDAGAERAGVHCCGPAEWQVVADAAPDLVSAPAGSGLEQRSDVVRRLLARDAWIVWGVVRTDPRATAFDRTPERAVARLRGAHAELAAAGIDAGLLRSASWTSPDCGLAGVDEAAAVASLEACVAAAAHADLLGGG